MEKNRKIGFLTFRKVRLITIRFTTENCNIGGIENHKGANTALLDSVDMSIPHAIGKKGAVQHPFVFNITYCFILFNTLKFIL